VECLHNTPSLSRFPGLGASPQGHKRHPSANHPPACTAPFGAAHFPPLVLEPCSSLISATCCSESHVETAFETRLLSTRAKNRKCVHKRSERRSWMKTLPIVGYNPDSRHRNKARIQGATINWQLRRCKSQSQSLKCGLATLNSRIPAKPCPDEVCSCPPLAGQPA